MTRPEDHIRVFLRDCRVEWKIGIYEHEMLQAQPVSVTVELQASLPHRHDDRLERGTDRVIDYEALHEFVTRGLPAQGHIYLLETAAECIIDFCFAASPRVERVIARLEKTAVFPATAGAGIEITRSRAPA